MWISKKEYNRLADENLELKKKIEEMEDINEAIKEAKETTIKYKEVSKNKDTGLESLQFPVWNGLREDKNEVSYE